MLSLYLYIADTRKKSPITIEQLIKFDDKSLDKVNEIACLTFNADKRWDQYLIYSCFAHSYYNRFELIKRYSSHIIYGLKFSGEKTFIIDNEANTFEPIDQPVKLFVHLKEKQNKESFEVSYQTLKEKYYHDYTLISLFNSQSFRTLSESNSETEASRITFKLNPKF